MKDRSSDDERSEEFEATVEVIGVVVETSSEEIVRNLKLEMLCYCECTRCAEAKRYGPN